MESAVNAAIAKEDASLALQRSVPPSRSPTATQLDLMDHGRYSHRTRAVAAASANRRTPTRRDEIELFVAGRGNHGATRQEIANALEIGIQSVCGPVCSLIESGRLVETSRKRANPTGSAAAVIVSRLVSEGAGLER